MRRRILKELSLSEVGHGRSCDTSGENELIKAVFFRRNSEKTHGTPNTPGLSGWHCVGFLLPSWSRPMDLLRIWHWDRDLASLIARRVTSGTDGESQAVSHRGDLKNRRRTRIEVNPQVVRNWPSGPTYYSDIYIVTVLAPSPKKRVF